MLLLVVSLLALACSFFCLFFYLLEPLFSINFFLNAASADCRSLLGLIFAAQWSLAVEIGSPSVPLLVNTFTDSDAPFAEERQRSCFCS